jgi:ubiquinone/menaquinone biosynthesis C-methylase UbiE
MGFYNDVILPQLCALVMRIHRLVPYRERVIGMAEGRVLEIGIGSGLNLPRYRSPVREVLAPEPSPRLVSMARRAAVSAEVGITFLEASTEAIPLDDQSIDTIVTTWTLCSLPRARDAVGEMRRVLRPRGRLLFVEHGFAPDDGVRRWQDRLTPAWKAISGGCHLNRAIRNLIESGGFRLDRLETGYTPGPKPWTFLYEDGARPSSSRRVSYGLEAAP